MQDIWNRLAKLGLTLFAVGALTFGASEVLAANASSQCIINPPSELGECSSEEQCDAMCRAVGGVDGDCQTGCCGCFTR